jgi:hypothetical protein
MLARGIREAAVALLWDPIAVDFAHRVGAGSRLALRLGGKVGPMSGAPLDVEAEVLCVREDAPQAWFAQGEPRVFTAHGIDPRKCRYVVVKSTAYFQNGFAPIASRILFGESPGSLTFDPAHLPYRKVPRPLYSIDVDFTPRPLPLPGRGQQTPLRSAERPRRVGAGGHACGRSAATARTARARAAGTGIAASRAAPPGARPAVVGLLARRAQMAARKKCVARVATRPSRSV